VVIEITNADGTRSIGHILDGAIDRLREAGRLNSKRDLQIYMDRWFLELEEKQFSMLDTTILRRLKAKAREFCGYLFLSRQKIFTKAQNGTTAVLTNCMTMLDCDRKARSNGRSSRKP